MHLFDQRILGTGALLLIGMLVIVKLRSTGSLFEKPKGTLLLQVVNIFNLFFLLVVNPLTAILLITRRLEATGFSRFIINEPWILTISEIAGMVLFVTGYLLMAWALIRLGGNYQSGGSAPRSDDKMVLNGPYGLVRHPMYTAALCISLGLACLIRSWILVSVFCIYLGLIILLIPAEENELRNVYGEQYNAYRIKVKKIIPFVY